jgi:hypothetical protein
MREQKKKSNFGRKKRNQKKKGRFEDLDIIAPFL